MYDHTKSAFSEVFFMKFAGFTPGSGVVNEFSYMQNYFHQSPNSEAILGFRNHLYLANKILPAITFWSLQIQKKTWGGEIKLFGDSYSWTSTLSIGKGRRYNKCFFNMNLRGNYVFDVHTQPAVYPLGQIKFLKKSYEIKEFKFVIKCFETCRKKQEYEGQICT